MQYNANNVVPSSSNKSNTLNNIKSLFKAAVLISNVVPVITGFWLAIYFSGGTFSDQWSLFLLTIGGSSLVMAGALVINNWYDEDIDSIMDRTKKRPTVTGAISLKTVLSIGIGLTVVGFIFLFFTTMEVVIYAFIGWFTYVVLYTMWSKRRYTWNTLIGSVSGAVTPLIGWAAVESTITNIAPIILFLIIFFWQMPHTYAIAIRRYEEYKAAEVAMLPVVKGLLVTKIHFLFYIVCLIPLPFFLGSIGTGFVVVATLFNFVWIVVCIRGFFTADNKMWAKINFLFSVNYLMILFVLMIVMTLPIF